MSYKMGVDGRKAVEWCEVLPSHDATHVKKMELSETISVTLKDDVWLFFISH
jgi:hypothetical protein